MGSFLDTRNEGIKSGVEDKRGRNTEKIQTSSVSGKGSVDYILGLLQIDLCRIRCQQAEDQSALVFRYPKSSRSRDQGQTQGSTRSKAVAPRR